MGQAPRYLLAYAEADWEDKKYVDREQWFNVDKTGLGIQLPNLPYLIDGDYKLTETTSIIRYLPKRLGKPELLGKTIQDQGRVDQILGVLSDVQTTLIKDLVEEGWEAKRGEIYAKVQAKLSQLEEFVQENYALGYLTIADFKLSDFVFVLNTLFAEESKDLKKLQSIATTFYEIPQIKKYLATGVRTAFAPFVKANVTLPGGN